MEHRWGIRNEVNKAVRLETRSGTTGRGRVTNVSISGAFIVSPLPVRLHSHVTVQFTALQHHKRNQLAVEAQVVRKEASGFAIEWYEFTPDVLRALANRPLDLPVAAYQ
jgi:hypothetical protein